MFVVSASAPIPRGLPFLARNIPHPIVDARLLDLKNLAIGVQKFNAQLGLNLSKLSIVSQILRI
jgi:hypothetical protein